MQDISKTAFDTLLKAEFTLTTAESCTGGMIAAAITDHAGSSQVFDRGFITYSNESKAMMLNVSHGTLNKHGAVSHKCAIEMAQGALKNSAADIAISVTGIAGPGGGSPEKPIGLVYLGYATKNGKNNAIELRLHGDRDTIRRETKQRALKHIIALCEAEK